jgi:hypothetical protein
VFFAGYVHDPFAVDPEVPKNERGKDDATPEMEVLPVVFT